MIRPARTWLTILAAGLFLSLGAPHVTAAEQTESTEGDTSRIERLKQALEAENAEPQTGPAPILLPREQLDPDTLRSMQQSLKAYYDYRTHGFDHRKAVFAWQLLSAKIIFAIVVLLVAIGIYFSWIQFTAGMKKESTSPPASKATPTETTQDTPAPPQEPAVTTLEASPSGIKVSSPVLGVILLVISLAFFYLYLVYVYPIEEIF
jgi:septal ring-binding cell division protein DamX